MTSQIPDIVVIDCIDHAIAGIDGGPLFDPADHGIEPGFFSTGCWRGCYCDYVIRHGRLLLYRLTFGEQAVGGDRPSALFGAPVEEQEFGEFTVDPPRLEILFSGRLLGAILEGDLLDPDGVRGARGWVQRTFELDYGRTFPGR
ncbi:hypothetical protein ETD86_44380 [Nonomuraea turkmeniaca]|uniref:Uncharacterized protein n=1 Tax=Nonomuraea turkmeniaca TaxID=103838 RepID=A0A5S4F0A9_9ACTN|nr:hypothetical protein [Nonomuraea turkmeniaca]TMR09263.1 hypothetical protein ETD86_44380 [Nonomuraea turkmeniaca]